MGAGWHPRRPCYTIFCSIQRRKMPSVPSSFLSLRWSHGAKIGELRGKRAWYPLSAAVHFCRQGALTKVKAPKHIERGP